MVQQRITGRDCPQERQSSLWLTRGSRVWREELLAWHTWNLPSGAFASTERQSRSPVCPAGCAARQVPLTSADARRLPRSLALACSSSGEHCLSQKLPLQLCGYAALRKVFLTVSQAAIHQLCWPARRTLSCHHRTWNCRRGAQARPFMNPLLNLTTSPQLPYQSVIFEPVCDRLNGSWLHCEWQGMRCSTDVG